MSIEYEINNIFNSHNHNNISISDDYVIRWNPCDTQTLQLKDDEEESAVTEDSDTENIETLKERVSGRVGGDVEHCFDSGMCHCNGSCATGFSLTYLHEQESGVSSHKMFEIGYDLGPCDEKPVSSDYLSRIENDAVSQIEKFKAMISDEQ